MFNVFFFGGTWLVSAVLLSIWTTQVLREWKVYGRPSFLVRMHFAPPSPIFDSARYYDDQMFFVRGATRGKALLRYAIGIVPAVNCLVLGFLVLRILLRVLRTSAQWAYAKSGLQDYLQAA